MVVAPHTGAKVQIEPLSSVPWDGYGRLLQGGRGDGLARSVAAAARRFAHPGSGRLAAARRADALAARRVQSAGQRFIERLFIARTGVATPAAEPVPELVPLASVRTPAGAGDTGVAGLVLILVVGIAACVVRVPALTRRSRND